MKPIIANNSVSTQDRGFNVVSGENGLQVSGSVNGVHLSIFPRGHENDTTAYNVIVSAETADGAPNFCEIFNSTIIDLNQSDVEEAAEMYMGRLKNNVKPVDLFRDQSETTINQLIEIHKGLTKK